jgi:hypothetical protein
VFIYNDYDLAKITLNYAIKIKYKGVVIPTEKPAFFPNQTVHLTQIYFIFCTQAQIWQQKTSIFEFSIKKARKDLGKYRKYFWVLFKALPY